MESKNLISEKNTTNWVIKVGSDLAIQENFLENLANQIAEIVERVGNQVHFTIVLSGAIAEGRKEVGRERSENESLPTKQALSMIGQAPLYEKVRKVFKEKGLKIATGLVSYNDLDGETGVTNMRRALSEVHNMGRVAILNENDGTSTREITFGDNDNLAAQVSQVVSADVMTLLTCSNGIFNQNDKTIKNISVDKFVHYWKHFVETCVKKGTTNGTGGPPSKIRACVEACNSNVKHVQIGNGEDDKVLLRILENETGANARTYTTFTGKANINEFPLEKAA